MVRIIVSPLTITYQTLLSCAPMVAGLLMIQTVRRRYPMPWVLAVIQLPTADRLSVLQGIRKATTPVFPMIRTVHPMALPGVSKILPV